MSAPLPDGVFELWAALDSGPPEAHEVCAAVMAAMQSQSPRMTLNNAVRGLRSRHSRPLHTLRDWLNRPEVNRQAGIRGAHWALKKWQFALDRIIDDGWPAHKAFGGAQPGRQPQKYFTSAERAAIFGEYRRRSGVDLNRALAEFAAQPHVNVSPNLDEREVRRALRDMGLKELTLSEIRTLATGPAGPLAAKKCAGSDKSGV